VGFALHLIDEAEALETLALLQEIESLGGGSGLVGEQGMTE
jgi:hydrogenase maturation factor